MPALAFLVTAAYWPGLISPAVTPRWCALAAGLALASPLDVRRLNPWVGILMVTGIICAALSLLVSPDPAGGAFDLICLALLCGAAVAAAGLDDLDPVMTGVALGLLPSIALCVISWEWYGTWIVPQMSARSGGFFANSGVLAELCAMVFIWMAVKRRWAYAAVLAIPLVLCHSRIALMMVVIACAYAIWPKSARARALLCLAAFLIAMVMIFGAGAGQLTSAEWRADMWQEMLGSITVTGKGLGWFWATHPYQWRWAHSDVLQSAVELGLGGLPFLAIPVVVFRQGRPDLAARACFVAICFDCFVSFPIHLPASGFAAALFAGYLSGGRAHLRLSPALGRAGVPARG